MAIIGHKTQWELLKRVVGNGRVPQAMLFSGEDSLGKKKVGVEFIKLLNCKEQDFSKKFTPNRNLKEGKVPHGVGEVSGSGPCQTCLSCTLIEKGKHPDLLVIEPQTKISIPGRVSAHKEIQISQIRELQRTLSFKSQISPLKSVIIDEAQALRPEAQHCFLKTLEEPKGRALFLLITSRPEMLFETIRSRCEILKFYKVSPKEMEKHFSAGSEVSRSQLKEILLISEGRPGVAVDFLLNPQKLKEHIQRMKEIVKISSLKTPGRFKYAKELSETPQQLNGILETWLRHFRGHLISALDKQEKASLEKSKEIIKTIERTSFLISSTNINARLALETLMLEL